MAPTSVSAVPSASASASASALPPMFSQAPPLFEVTPTNQSGVIVIITGFCLAVGLVATLVRVYVRSKVTGQRLAWDDGVIGTAMLAYIVQAIMVFYEVHNGFGDTIGKLNRPGIDKIQKFMYADGFFYILSIWVSKISTTFLYMRLSRQRSHRFMNFGIMGVLALTCFISILIIALRCDISRPWEYFNLAGTTCSDPINRWSTIAAFDLITELMLALASIFLVTGLQMDFGKKASVVFAFDLRLLVIVPIALRLYYLNRAYDTDNPTLMGTDFTIVTQVQLATAITLASVPTLRPFMLATATHYGAPADGPRTTANGNSAGSFNLRNIASRMRKGNSQKDMMNSHASTQNGYDKEAPDLPGNHDHYSQANVTSGQTKEEMTRGSDDSQEMIIRKDGIRKDVRYVVEYGDQR